MKVTHFPQQFNTYTPRQSFVRQNNLPNKSASCDVFVSSELQNAKPSFTGSPIQKLLNNLHFNKMPLLLAYTPCAAKNCEIGISAFAAKTECAEKKFMDLFGELFRQKLKGKNQLKICGLMFDMQKTTQGISVFVERGGDMEISVQKVNGKRIFSILDKKTNSQLIQDSACGYKLIINDGNYVKTIETSFTKNDTQNVTSRLSTTKDSSGKIIEVAEQGCNGHEYKYNFLTGDFEYSENIPGKSFYKKYKTSILKPEEVAYSQNSINEEGFTTLKASMSQNGWTREPIHVIRSKDGHLVSLDNRRLRAATETNTPIKAIIHEANEELSPIFRVRHQIYNPETNEIIAQPKTWGEIIYNRLLQNGLVKDGHIEYSTKAPEFGDNPYTEGILKLFELYSSGKAPCSI